MKQVPKFVKIKNEMLDTYFQEPALDIGSWDARLELTYPIHTAMDYYNDHAEDKVLRFLNWDINDFPYPIKKKFNTIICYGTAYYVTDIERFFKQISNMLTDDGVFLVNTTNDMEHARQWSQRNKVLPLINDALTETEFAFQLRKHFDIIAQNYNKVLGIIPSTRLRYYVCRKKMTKKKDII